jgi:hypothetical protein
LLNTSDNIRGNNPKSIEYLINLQDYYTCLQKGPHILRNPHGIDLIAVVLKDFVDEQETIGSDIPISENRKEAITTIKAIIVRAITEIRRTRYKLISPIFFFL